MNVPGKSRLDPKSPASHLNQMAARSRQQLPARITYRLQPRYCSLAILPFSEGVQLLFLSLDWLVVHSHAWFQLHEMLLRVCRSSVSVPTSFEHELLACQSQNISSYPNALRIPKCVRTVYHPS